MKQHKKCLQHLAVTSSSPVHFDAASPTPSVQPHAAIPMSPIQADAGSPMSPVQPLQRCSSPPTIPAIEYPAGSQSHLANVSNDSASGQIPCEVYQEFEVENRIDSTNGINTIQFANESPSEKIIREPYEGMEFQSVESVMEYYNEYANSKGFCMRVGRKNKSRKDGELIGQEFVCSKEGFRSKKYLERVDRVNPVPDETRVGCKAMIKVSKGDGCKWVISRFVLQHNHEFVTPRSAKFFRTKRKKSVAQLNLIDVLDESGVRASKIMSVLATEAGGIDRLNLNEKNVRNYLSNKRQKSLENGDDYLMLTYFREEQAKNPGFFYAIQADREGQLANCFWVDARSRMAYKYFGDVVTFDPTYLTNKYKMPFVPFTGVNHHRQSILFGCALLWDETEETFVWLLRTWLTAMFEHPPLTIITDQDQAITNAVRKVFPKSVHHFCMWHIMKKVPEVLSHVYHQNEEFRYQFSKCIHQTITPEEFESAWKEIIVMYNLENNDWLNRIYLVREKWIPAYLRSTFCAGMSTTQRSESMNNFFKDYVNSSTPISSFVLQYEKALNARYDREREKNFKTKISKPVLKTLYPMEEQAAQSYTRKIFRLFQEELIQSQRYIYEKIDIINGIYKYKVHEFSDNRTIYFVDLNLVPKEVVCTCKKFEFEGILCRHILMVLIKKKIISLPARYILNRWTMNATKDKVVGLLSEEIKENGSMPSTLWFNSIMVHSIGLSEKSSQSQEHYNLTIACLQELYDKLDLLPVQNEKEIIKNDFSQNNFGTDASDQNLSRSLDENITLLDPPHVVSKGRPRTIRIKGHLEKSKKTCSLCKVKGHTKPTCPSLKKSRCATNGEEMHNYEAN